MVGLAEDFLALFVQKVSSGGIFPREGVPVGEEGADGFDFYISPTQVFRGVLDGEEAFKVQAGAALGLLQDLAVGGVGDTFGEYIL